MVEGGEGAGAGGEGGGKGERGGKWEVTWVGDKKGDAEVTGEEITAEAYEWRWLVVTTAAWDCSLGSGGKNIHFRITYSVKIENLDMLDLYIRQWNELAMQTIW